MSRRAELHLWLAVLLGFVFDAVPFLSALSASADSPIDRFYAPTVWSVELLCGAHGYRAVRPLIFFAFCSLQNALTAALLTAPFLGALLPSKKAA